MENFQHETVLLTETIDLLNPQPGKVFLDCTLGAGGHSELLLQRMKGSGLVIGLDQDQEALNSAQARLQSYGDCFRTVRYNFKDLDLALREIGIEQVDGVLFDLGVSSPQLDWETRGFSYWGNAALDMRMDLRQSVTAAEILATSSSFELTRILREYGEEKWASRIAQFIVNARENAPIQTADQLVEIIKAAIPASARREGGHPAKRTFQALRIAVNQELDVLKIGLDKALQCLRPEGVLAAITFHSLEDRIVKRYFKEQANPCICPPKIPICVCGRLPTVRILTSKPILPTDDEIARNPRSRSAKLRAAEKLSIIKKVR